MTSMRGVGVVIGEVEKRGGLRGAANRARPLAITRNWAVSLARRLIVVDYVYMQPNTPETRSLESGGCALEIYFVCNDNPTDWVARVNGILAWNGESTLHPHVLLFKISSTERSFGEVFPYSKLKYLSVSEVCLTTFVISVMV